MTNGPVLRAAPITATLACALATLAACVNVGLKGEGGDDSGTADSEMEASEAGLPDTGSPETGSHETGSLEAGAPEASPSDGARPETGRPSWDAHARSTETIPASRANRARS